jgi:kanamycin kinase/aminoglycoside 3'-phosphotransferase-3
MDQFIPESIKQLIGKREYSIDKIGMSDSQVICFPDMVLKIEGESEESNNEHRILKWLHLIVYFGQFDQWSRFNLTTHVGPK